MKFILKVIIILFFAINSAFAIEEEVEVYSLDNKFGLKCGEVEITEAKYSKLIRLKDKSYLFMYKNKYGIISKTGEILVEPVYTSAVRYVGRFAKLGLRGKYALFNEDGDMIINREYSSIDILFGRMFLVSKDYKYGLITFDGDILLTPVADDIYMPDRNTMKIKYDGEWYEIQKNETNIADFSDGLMNFASEKDNFTITKIVENPVATAGYGIVSTSDYFIKIFSSISPAYESTIDELFFSYGADTASVLIKSFWLAKFPYVYAKNYVNNLKAPNNGPLSEVKSNLKSKIK